MKCKRRNRIKMAINKIERYAPKHLNLTNIKALVRFKESGIQPRVGRVLTEEDFYSKNLLASEKLNWLIKLSAYSGKRSENLEYLTIRFNSEEKARQYMEAKGKRVSGKNNPAYGHGGKLSPWSRKSEFFDENSHRKAIENSMKNPNHCTNQTRIEYYLQQGMTEEEAKLALKERQTTFSLKKCIEKYGENEGRKRWEERQQKWAKNYKKSNFSKISQELFWAILKECPTLNINNIKFATLGKDKSKDESGRNNEERLNINGVILPDFIVLNTKRIIEFDGTYWHGKVGHGNKKREELRNKRLLEQGYNVLHVTESEFNNDREATIQKCINFLTQ